VEETQSAFFFTRSDCVHNIKLRIRRFKLGRECISPGSNDSNYNDRVFATCPSRATWSKESVVVYFSPHLTGVDVNCQRGFNLKKGKKCTCIVHGTYRARTHHWFASRYENWCPCKNLPIHPATICLYLSSHPVFSIEIQSLYIYYLLNKMFDSYSKHIFVFQMMRSFKQDQFQIYSAKF
jgi:hypothetical protein